jgi:hypothetical protein
MPNIFYHNITSDEIAKLYLSRIRDNTLKYLLEN